MVKISNRLMTVASLISEGNVLADVGTDHGYVPIYLMEQGKIPRAIAMDINAGPLERAKEHIAGCGMGDYIETRLSDGLEALRAGEAESILIAGMGGGLVIHILEAGEAVAKSAGELILQPQSELERVRIFLEENGYVTDAEDMVFEDGKFYPMMRVHYEPERGRLSRRLEGNPESRETQRDNGTEQHIPAAERESGEQGSTERRLGYLYGAGLLRQRHPVLLAYLKKERDTYRSIYENLKKQPAAGHIEIRLQEIENALAQNQMALAYYGDTQL